MKSWKKIIDDAFIQKKSRGWEKFYWAIDLHDTVITGKHNSNYNKSTLFPNAKKTLDYLFDHPNHVTILWTSSYDKTITDVLKQFDLKFNYFNENPECCSSDLCDFQKKMYFNFLLDDKAGFDPQSDWEEIHKSLTENDSHLI